MSAVRCGAAVLAMVLALGAGGCGPRFGSKAASVGGSTLERTVADPDGNGDVTRGSGEPMIDRTDLAPRGTATREVARLGQLTDTHVRDEESPARVPFLDRLGPPVTSTFRPQEALSPQVLNAAIRALNAERPQAVLFTGDLVDNAQRNELDQFLGVVEGGAVDPNSGGPGYRGVQSASNPDGFFYRPDLDAPRLPGLLRRAEEPFFAQGVRAPWYAALGNHDLLVQGEQPPSAATDRIATGDRALLTFDPDLADRVRSALPARGARPAATPDLRDIPRGAIERLLSDGVPSARATTVPPDPGRRHVGDGELQRALERATGVRADGERLNFAVDVGREVRVVVLDTVTRSGGATGSLAESQVAFLRRQLARAGTRSVVVVDHHGLDRVPGAAAARARALLSRDRRVVLELAGDTHRNSVQPVRTTAGGFWRIHTSSLADWPQQGRMIRLVAGPGGRRAIETWMVDQAGGFSARDLAGAARQLAYDDAQGGRPTGLAGTRRDRNVRLWLPALP